MDSVLLVTDSYRPNYDGMATSIKGIATALRDLGKPVTVVWISPGPTDDRTDYDDEGIKVIRCSFTRPSFRLPMHGINESRRILHAVLAEGKPTHVWVRWPIYAVALARYFKNTPFVYVVGNSHPVSILGAITGLAASDTPRRAKLAYLYLVSGKWEKEILEACSRTVVFSRDGLAQFQERHGGLSSKVAVVYPGITKKQIAAPAFPVAQTWLKREWGIPDHRKLIMYVGHMGGAKVASLWEAIALLRRRDESISEKQWHVMFVGPGADPPSFRKRASKLGVADSVTYCGVQKELLGAYYSGAWAHVLPSHVESFGYVLVEAAVCSAPSIAFSADGKRTRVAADDIIVDNQTGLLAKPATAEGLANAIEKALSWSEEERERIGMNAREHVLGKFSWDRFVKEVLAFSEE
ncbi:MAG: D-inositol 3-phosphate glycosyltransferase [Candidatus Latescibacteria bacterium ADurb.Bin168]|nr:MAG: D-inositol 3-phosphate glycosyltransferase [Candidatus Latescibacteria bacterium ADurb.Bin168]